MRITAKIATSAHAGLSRFPVPNASIDECLTDGRFDEAKARAALKCDQVQIGAKDDRRVLAFTMEFLKQQESVVKKLAAGINKIGECKAVVSGNNDVRTEAATPGDRQCERRMNQGRHAFVRADFSGCSDGIHAKLSVQNPFGVVGDVEGFAHNFAVMLARILIYLRDNITTAKITLAEGDGAAGVFAEAEEMDRTADLSKLRASCDRLHNGACSPCKFDCPLYRNGKCRNPEEENS